MSLHTPPPIRLHSRGLRPRNNATASPPSFAEATSAIAELNKAVAEMRSKNDDRLAALERGRDDVVAREQVERIGKDVQSLQAIAEQMSSQLAAARISGNGGPGVRQEVTEHAQAFKSWFCNGVVPANMRQLEIAATLSTDSKPDGGFVVPEEVETAITRAVGLSSVIRRLATVRTISTGNYKKLHNLGGAGSGWVGEKGARPNTNTPTLSELDFPVMEIYAQPAATQNLLDDARIDIGSWLGEEVQITFAEQEGDAFVDGDGNAKPFGLLSYPKVANASWAWGKTGFVTTGVAAAINDGSNNGVDGLKRLKYGLKAAYQPGATFIMNRTTAYQVSILKDGDLNYLWQPSNGVGEPALLLGHPVEQDDNFPDAGANTFPVAFGDINRGYLIVDRAGITVLRDPYTSKPYVLFYTTKRVGGGVQDFDAFKMLKCST